MVVLCSLCNFQLCKCPLSEKFCVSVSHLELGASVSTNEKAGLKATDQSQASKWAAPIFIHLMIDEALAHKLNTKWCYKHCAIQQPQDAKWINKCIAMASIQYYHERDRMNQWNSIADNKYFFEGSIRFDWKSLYFVHFLHVMQ